MSEAVYHRNFVTNTQTPNHCNSCVSQTLWPERWKWALHPLKSYWFRASRLPQTSKVSLSMDRSLGTVWHYKH